jgi:two-component system LytT family response regulator
MEIRVLVVDDEPIARRRLLRLLEQEEGVQVVGTCSDGFEAVEAIRNEQPNLIFLDVQMPEMDGFGVVEAIGAEHMPAVIFATAFDQYAIRAFEVHALDYLLKPFSAERLRAALQRARSRISANPAERSQQLFTLLEHLSREQQRLVAPAERYVDRVMVKVNSRFLFVRAPEIEWIEAEGNYLRLHVGENSYLIRETLSAMEGRLDPQQFLRIHRSTIVNLDQVKELRPWFAGDYIVALHNGTELKMSRGYREKLTERMEPPRT